MFTEYHVIQFNQQSYHKNGRPLCTNSNVCSKLNIISVQTVYNSVYNKQLNFSPKHISQCITAITNYIHCAFLQKPLMTLPTIIGLRSFYA